MRVLTKDRATDFFPARSHPLALLLPLFWVRDHHGDSAWLALLLRRWQIFLVFESTEA